MQRSGNEGYALFFLFFLLFLLYLLYMKITLNPDKEIVEKIQAGLKAKGGYCPCRLEKSEDNKCMCPEFREQIKNPEFEGFCHCMLYYKSKD